MTNFIRKHTSSGQGKINSLPQRKDERRRHILRLSAMNCHHRFYELKDFFAASKENGYENVEIWTGPQHFFMDHNGYENVDKLLRLEEKYNIKIIGICPEQTNPKPNNMAAKDREMQKRVLAYFKNAVDVACKVEANQVVVTSGWGFLNEQREEVYKRSVQMLRKVSDYAFEKNMTLAIEALQPDESMLVHTAEEMKQLIDDVDSPALKVCIDTGAMVRAKDTIDDYFKIFGDRIVHAHFVDVDEDHFTTHLAWGDGTRNMKEELEAFRRNGYKGFLSVECVNGRYFENPKVADKQSMKNFLKFK